MSEILFTDFLKTYRGGVLDKILGMQLQKAVNASQQHNKAASLKLDVSIKPKNTGEVETVAKYTTKLPVRDTIASIMFVTPEGNLITDDPNQPKLFDHVESALIDSQTGEIVTPSRTIED